LATPDFKYDGSNLEGAAMAVRHMRLAIGLFFLLMGVGVLALRFGAPEQAAKINDPTRLTIGGCMALVLAGWNFATWYAGWMWFRQQSTPVRQPLQPDRDARTADEYNPELDFGKDANKPAQ
jgi:hypothetical protein